MLKIEAGQFLESVSMQGIGADGMPEAQITIQGNWELQNIQNNVFELQEQMRKILDEKEKEARLIAENPALKDLHDQYKVVYTIVKKADDALNEQCNGGG